MQRLHPHTMTCKVHAIPNVSDGTATFPPPLSLCEREQLLTSLRVIRDAGEGVIRGQEDRMSRGQADLEDRKVGR